MSDLSYAVRYPGQCHEEVSRQHEAQPCDKTAVAVRQNIDGGEPYPVCAFHARGDGMVPLSDLIEAGRAAFAADLRDQGKVVVPAGALWSFLYQEGGWNEVQLARATLANALDEHYGTVDGHKVSDV